MRLCRFLVYIFQPSVLSQLTDVDLHCGSFVVRNTRDVYLCVYVDHTLSHAHNLTNFNLTTNFRDFVSLFILVIWKCVLILFNGTNQLLIPNESNLLCLFDFVINRSLHFPTGLVSIVLHMAMCNVSVVEIDTTGTHWMVSVSLINIASQLINEFCLI